MDQRTQLERDIAFVNGLLAVNGYHPFWKDLLLEAKQQMEQELSDLKAKRVDSAA
jgi:hypothetical protein